MNVAVFLGVFTVLWCGGHWYMGRRIVPRLGLSARGRKLAWAGLLTSGTVSLVALTTFRLALSIPMGLLLQWVGMILFGVTSVLFFMVVATDLVGLGVLGVRRVLTRPDTRPADPSRRGFFGRVASLGAVATAGSVGGVGIAQARQTAEVVEVDVPIQGLPEALEGYRIVQLSDIHVSPTIRRDDLQAMVDRANELDADLVAVTGDLVDGYVEDLREQVAPLAQLRGRDGAYFVTGNHEYYWNGPQWCDEVKRLGLTVLNNEHRVIERGGARLLVGGCTDYKAGDHVAAHASDPAAARAGAPGCDVSLLLAHQPRSIYAAAEAGYDLQLSGHTHGGQYFPVNLLVYLAQPYVAGLALHQSTWIYVSRGTGYWGPPMRVGAPHEITLLRLRRA